MEITVLLIGSVEVDSEVIIHSKKNPDRGVCKCKITKVYDYDGESEDGLMFLYFF